MSFSWDSVLTYDIEPTCTVCFEKGEMVYSINEHSRVLLPSNNSKKITIWTQTNLTTIPKKSDFVSVSFTNNVSDKGNVKSGLLLKKLHDLTKKCKNQNLCADYLLSTHKKGVYFLSRDIRESDNASSNSDEVNDSFERFMKTKFGITL